MTALSYSQAHFSGKIFNRLFFRKTQRVLFTIWIVGSHRMTVAIFMASVANYYHSTIQTKARALVLILKII